MRPMQLLWACMCTTTATQFAGSVVFPLDHSPPLFWLIAGIVSVYHYTKAQKA